MNRGFQLEYDFINYFNNKRFIDLSEKWKGHFRKMFPGIKKRDYITSYKYKDKYAKPDIVIEVKNQRVLLSIKTGHNPTFHCEKFHSFYVFLKSLGLSYETLSIITFYHFGESKRFGHHDKPLTKEEIVKMYPNRILRANNELNQERVIRSFIKRSIIKGAISSREPIDFLYYGVLDKGLLINKKEIYSSILGNRNFSSDFIKIGELVYQPGCRSRDRKDYLQTTIHWPILCRLFYECKDENDILNHRQTT